MYLHRHTQLFDQYRHSPPETRRRPRTSARDRCPYPLHSSCPPSQHLHPVVQKTHHCQSRSSRSSKGTCRSAKTSECDYCLYGQHRRHPDHQPKLPTACQTVVTSAVRSPLSYERSTRVEFLNAIIAGVSYINVVGQISGDSFWSTATTRQQEAHRESTSISCFLKQPRVLSEG